MFRKGITIILPWLVAFVPACHESNEESTPHNTVTGPSCSDIAAQCVADGLGCTEDAAGARCAACSGGTYASSTGTCEPIAGTTMTHTFPEQTVESGEERLHDCRSWTLNNESEIWVNTVELTQNEDSHHSNWVFVPETEFDGPDGIWTCSSRGYDFWLAVQAGGLVYAQSTQTAHEVQRFPAGAAVRIPPHARIISDIHLLNTSSETITGHATLTLYTLAPETVKTPLSAFHIEYDALNIPAHASARFTGECAVGGAVTQATGQAFAPKVHYLLPHTHTLATGFFAKILGGPRDGEALLDLGVYNGEAHGRTFDPPIDMAGADGFQFGCQYQNTSDTNVGWGFGAGEMCELFGFAEGSPFFQGYVSAGAAAGVDGTVQLFEGSCTTQVFSEK
ncbi:Hypothetical protein A7982_02606 [Minicystis rosea]|nr:Hypothetical protein A7982_02606 [Minicystis rosea]